MPGRQNPNSRGNRPSWTQSLGMFLLLTLVLMAAVGCENQQQIQRGVLSGAVLDTLGNAIAGARVTSHRSLFVAETDRNGHYAFTSLDSGNHRILVEREGYESASGSTSIDQGVVREGLDFRLKPLQNRIAWTLFRRETQSVTVDVTTVEPMTCIAVYQGVHLPVIRTVPSALGLEHRFLLSPLLPDIDYSLVIEGTTSDGRRYRSASGTFHPQPQGDLPGAPNMPFNASVVQTREGPKLSWSHDGLDPIKGFRIFRAENDDALKLWQDEDFVFPDQNFLIDDEAKPGIRTRYALTAIDRDGNSSSQTAELVFMPAGRLTTDVVWKSSWKTIELAGDIEIPERTTLTIEPGLTIRFAETDLAQGGLDPLRCEMLVEGRLNAGTSGGSLIRFMSASGQPTRNNWMGIRMRGTALAVPSNLYQIEVANADYGLQIGECPFTLSGFTARACETGLALQGASGTAVTGLTFEECRTAFTAESTLNCSATGITIRGGELGITMRANRFFSLSEADIRDTLSGGIELSDTASPTIRRCLIQSRGLGLNVKGNNGVLRNLTIDAPNGVLIDGGERPDLRNSIIVNRRFKGTGTGIEEKTAGRAYPWNTVYGYQLALVNCTQDGGAFLNVDPRFVGGSESSYDYHLAGDSPLRTASDDGREIGAYGGL